MSFASSEKYASVLPFCNIDQPLHSVLGISEGDVRDFGSVAMGLTSKWQDMVVVSHSIK
jgi:hypothetical protein